VFPVFSARRSKCQPRKKGAIIIAPQDGVSGGIKGGVVGQQGIGLVWIKSEGSRRADDPFCMLCGRKQNCQKRKRRKQMNCISVSTENKIFPSVA